MAEQPEEPNYEALEMQDIIKVPKDRLGVIIGKSGKNKEIIEELTETSLDIDSENNTVVIKPKGTIKDPTLIWKARDIIKAIARGFNEKKAMKLVDSNFMLRIITLDFDKKSKKINRVRGRLIGENGKARKIMEDISGVDISVFGNTVSLIGEIEDLNVTEEAIKMIINGARHSTAYRHLEKFKQEKKVKPPQMWQKREDVVFEEIKKEFSNPQPDQSDDLEK